MWGKVAGAWIATVFRAPARQRKEADASELASASEDSAPEREAGGKSVRE